MGDAVRGEDLNGASVESGQPPQRRGGPMRHNGSRSSDEKCDLEVLPPTRERAGQSVDTVADDVPLLALHASPYDAVGHAERAHLLRCEHSVLFRGE
jgi:hypothetical protein